MILTVPLAHADVFFIHKITGFVGEEKPKSARPEWEGLPIPSPH